MTLEEKQIEFAKAVDYKPLFEKIQEFTGFPVEFSDIEIIIKPNSLAGWDKTVYVESVSSDIKEKCGLWGKIVGKAYISVCGTLIMLGGNMSIHTHIYLSNNPKTGNCFLTAIFEDNKWIFK